MITPPPKPVETVPHRTLRARYGVNRINPVLEIDDGVPGGSDEYNPPGLNHCRFFTPCLSMIPHNADIVEWVAVGTVTPKSPVP